MEENPKDTEEEYPEIAAKYPESAAKLRIIELMTEHWECFKLWS